MAMYETTSVKKKTAKKRRRHATGRVRRPPNILATLQSRGVKIRGRGGWSPEVLAKLIRNPTIRKVHRAR